MSEGRWSTSTSVVRNGAAIDAAFCRAQRVTFAVPRWRLRSCRCTHPQRQLIAASLAVRV